MKKKVSFFILVIIGGIFIYKSLFYGVKFVGDHSTGGVVKTEEEKLKAYVFCEVRNGCFIEKEVTFEIFPDKEYEIKALEEEQYAISEICIQDGRAKISPDKTTITISAGAKVRLKICAEGTYVGNMYKGEAVTIRRAAPETRIVVID